MKPFFSVIICAYNRARLLPRALDSLLAQTEPDWEAIVVDDGSTDNTVGVVEKFIATDCRIRLVQNKVNCGASAAKNKGVHHAQGHFVTFLDSDDEYTTDHLATRKAILRQDNSICFLHGGVQLVGNPYVVDKDNYARKIHIDDCVLGGTFFIRSDVFEQVSGFDDLRYAEDSKFFERASAAGVKISQTNYPSYIYYRDAPDQLTNILFS